MKRIREFLLRLARSRQPRPEEPEDPAEALSDERVLGGARRR